MDLASRSRLKQAVKLMRGKVGDEVSLKLIRDGKSIDLGGKLREILSKSIKQTPTMHRWSLHQAPSKFHADAGWSTPFAP